MQKKYLIVLIAIIALGAFLRFYRITEIPLGLYPDEAMNGTNAQEALSTGHFKVFYPENNGREGLFINLQAISVAAFGPTPWALRLVSAIIGTLTILGIYVVTKELFSEKNDIPAQAGIQKINNWIPDQFGNDKIPKSDFPREVGLRSLNPEIIALLSAFFLAASYWHLNFSRIGFRAIVLPMMACFGMYFLLKGIRRGKPIDFILAGLFTGLGLYTYIAFRFMVFVFAVPMVIVAWQWVRARKSDSDVSRVGLREPSHLQSPSSKLQIPSCIPCSLALYVFVAFIVMVPIGLYFINHPQDFLNRAGEVSVFAAASPLKAFAKSAGLTLQMFFYKGDGNWRHNLAYAPELHPLVALFFLIGIITLLKSHFNRVKQAIILFIWFAAMLLPVALTRESVPHALRAIGMIPPVLILAALGADRIHRAINEWVAREKTRWPQKIMQLERIRRELMIFFLLTLLTIPLSTYRNYFLIWANNPETYSAFDTGHLHLGQYLAVLPQDTKKYVIVNTPGTMVRGIPMPSQTIMFTTDTFTDEKRFAKNFTYLLRGDADGIGIAAGQKTLITLLDETDRALIKTLQQKSPVLKVKVPGDFIILQNF